MRNITNEIINQAIAGDESAFELIFKAYFRFVSNVSYRIVDKKQEAEEVCQEVFIKIYKKINTFKQQSSLKTWIYRITINCALKYAQKKTKENNGLVSFDDENSVASPIKNVREKIDNQVNEKLVEKLLNYLNVEQRICIVLRSIEGLSYKEIAAVLKIPINTVRSRIKRAREAMIVFRQKEVSYEL